MLAEPIPAQCSLRGPRLQGAGAMRDCQGLEWYLERTAWAPPGAAGGSVRCGLSDLNLTGPRTGDQDPHDPRSLRKAHADTLHQLVDGKLTGKLIIVRCVAFSLEGHFLSVFLPPEVWSPQP